VEELTRLHRSLPQLNTGEQTLLRRSNQLGFSFFV
jgi:hypothetical protein